MKKLMKKFFIISILLAVIALSSVFAYLKIAANGPEDNNFNKYWRESFARFPKIRHILNLHYDGDAKADYLGTNYSKIIVNINSFKSLEVDKNVFEYFAEQAEKLTGKSARIVYSDAAVIYRPAVSFEDLKNAPDFWKSSANDSDATMINILIASKDSGDATKLGATFEENGIVLYLDTLKNVKNFEPDALDNYALGVLLHEFGHQIGLEHNNFEDCLMNPAAEFNLKALTDHPITDFCDWEKMEIKIIKTRYE